MSRKVDWEEAFSQLPPRPEPPPVDPTTLRARRLRAFATYFVAAVVLAGWTVAVVLLVSWTEPNIRQVPAGETDWGAVGEAAVEEKKEQVLDFLAWVAWFVVAALIAYIAARVAQRLTRRATSSS